MRTLIAFALAAASMVPAVAQQTPRPAPEFDFHMPDGSEKLLSSDKGKVTMVCFFFTTCSHCQDMSRLLSSTIVPEYGPKGVQFVAAAFNDGAKEQVPNFVGQFVHGFPMGYTDRGSVLEFLQASIMTPVYVPVLVFIDKKGNIDEQHIGDAFLNDPHKNIRAELDKLLAKPGPTAAKPLTHISKK